jgi:hypothetical protein
MGQLAVGFVAFSARSCATLLSGIEDGSTFFPDEFAFQSFAESPHSYGLCAAFGRVLVNILIRHCFATTTRCDVFAEQNSIVVNAPGAPLKKLSFHWIKLLPAGFFEIG